jgi:hypothetical protein
MYASKSYTKKIGRQGSGVKVLIKSELNTWGLPGEAPYLLENLIVKS